MTTNKYCESVETNSLQCFDDKFVGGHGIMLSLINMRVCVSFLI